MGLSLGSAGGGETGMKEEEAETHGDSVAEGEGDTPSDMDGVGVLVRLEVPLLLGVREGVRVGVGVGVGVRLGLGTHGGMRDWPPLSTGMDGWNVV